MDRDGDQATIAFNRPLEPLRPIKPVARGALGTAATGFAGDGRVWPATREIIADPGTFRAIRVGERGETSPLAGSQAQSAEARSSFGGRSPIRLLADIRQLRMHAGQKLDRSLALLIGEAVKELLFPSQRDLDDLVVQKDPVAGQRKKLPTLVTVVEPGLDEAVGHHESHAAADRRSVESDDFTNAASNDPRFDGEQRHDSPIYDPNPEPASVDG
jgi:hypothetical protein